MLSSLLGLELWFGAVFAVTGLIGRLIKSWIPATPKTALPLIALVVGILIMTGDAFLGGATWQGALAAALRGALAGATAAGAHHGIKSALIAVGLPEELVVLLLGRLSEGLGVEPPEDDDDDDEPEDTDPSKRASLAGMVLIVLVGMTSMTACHSFPGILAKVAKATSWSAYVDGIVDVAETEAARAAQAGLLAKDDALELADAFRDVRAGLSTLNELSAAAEAASASDLEAARDRILAAYLTLHGLLAKQGIGIAPGDLLADGGEARPSIPTPQHVASVW